MNDNTNEVARRAMVAQAAIKQALVDNDGDSCVALFVSHHLEEIGASYWQQYAGTPSPSPTQVLDLLELRSHWGAEDDNGIDTFDFTLPGDVTDYVIAVRFDESGNVESVEMES